MQTRRESHPIRSALGLGVLGLVILALVNYQALWDQFTLATYRPTAYVKSYESRIFLTDVARASLYRASPQVDGKAAFNADCQTQPHELELGCFFRGRIYVLQIDNKNLEPEMDVVTSHELLHAVWAGLPSKERQRLGAELERIYATLRDDDLQQRMAGYARSEPGEETNELHSILGTEYAQLSPLLEQHYLKYFKKRSQVVAAHSRYQQVFSGRRADLEHELAQIRTLKGQLGVINHQLEVYRAAGQIAAYNALVPRQNNLVDDINRRIEIYQAGVDEYNALSKSLDSQQITETEAPAR